MSISSSDQLITYHKQEIMAELVLRVTLTARLTDQLTVSESTFTVTFQPNIETSEDPENRAP